jgi:hypothetical protein
MEAVNNKFQGKSIYDLQRENLAKSRLNQKENSRPRKLVNKPEVKLFQLTQKAREELKKRQVINPFATCQLINQMKHDKQPADKRVIDKNIFKKPMNVPVKLENSQQPHREVKIEQQEITMSMIEDFYRMPPFITPIKTEASERIEHNPKPFTFESKERLIDDELKNMIDIFSKNIENLANMAMQQKESEEIESFIGRKRKLNSSMMSSMKRQKC